MRRLFLFTLTLLMLSCQLESPLEEEEIYVLTDQEEKLLDSIQIQTINYIWEGGESNSGAARERIHMDEPTVDENIVTSGGSGFGIMAIIVGIERGFIDREKGVDRLLRILKWLEKAERHHGAWPHWMDSEGKTVAFSQYDDGGDLVETSFLAQGLLVARQYFLNGDGLEKELAFISDKLWRGIDFNWYTNNEEVLFWHWSPNHEWKMNFRVRGHNECLIMYVLGASSPDHSVNPEVYHQGYMRAGEILSNVSFYDIPTVLDHYEKSDKKVGPLFWAHYSHLGLDPRNLKDKYANFWDVNRNHALIHYQHSLENPYEYKGYSEKCWGLTSSYSMEGYAGHNPQEDLGVISPTAALSSMPYTPEESLQFLKFLYEENPELVGEYGPYDAFSFQSDWLLPRYLAIDQLPIPVMIENYRTSLIWNLFMSAPEIKEGLSKLGFEYEKD